MGIYTKVGDFGYTKYKGKMVSKSDEIFELFGTIDEAQAYIDFASNYVSDFSKELLSKVSFELYRIMGAFYNETTDSLSSELDSMVKVFEEQIDRIEEYVGLPRRFTVLNSGKTMAALNIARVNVRKMERFLVGYKQTHTVDSSILIFVNRLSDYLYALATYYKENE